MPFVQLLPPNPITYGFDVSYPSYALEGGGAVAGAAGSVPSDASFYGPGGQASSNLRVNSGNVFSILSFGTFATVGSQDRFFAGGGMVGQACFRAGAGGIGKTFGVPAIASIPMEADELPVGFTNPDPLRVLILDFWLNWRLGGGGGVFDGQTTGCQLMAWDGASMNINSFLTAQGGGALPRVLCGVYGRSDGGVQQAQYRAFDEAETLLEDVDLVLADPEAWNNIRFVVTAAANSRPATLALHINDPLTPILTREFGTAVLAAPSDFTTTRTGYALAWAVVDASGALITREQLFRFRARAGSHLPDGTEVTS